MTGKALCFWVRCAIIAIAICGVGIWFVVYPTMIEIYDYLFIKNDVIKWVLFAFYGVTALPCFWILWMGWKVTTAIKEDRLFTKETAQIVKRATQILFIDIAVFFIGNMLFLFFEWHGVALLYMFFVIVGLVIGVFMAILSHYLYRAAELQEESEGTI